MAASLEWRLLVEGPLTELHEVHFQSKAKPFCQIYLQNGGAGSAAGPSEVAQLLIQLFLLRA